MGRGRLEAFSDGVLAIIITIMVLEMKVPHDGGSLASLQPLWPVFVSYVLSFMYVGIYWNNHHHLMHTAQHVNGKVLWANVHLLFWLSLLPFATGWMGENHFAQWPMVLYGFVLFMAGVAYYILSQQLIKLHGKKSTLAIAVGRDKKGIISVVIYAVAIAMAFIHPMIGFALYAVVAIIWFIPDRRIERVINKE
ncbi:MAG TPA: TMEM175 family protein [Chitinophagaceae bacterium]|nr:TMEM175 family protein [Chitinophagaceae bacterium]